MSALDDIHALADAAAARLGTTAPFAPPPGDWSEPVQARFIGGALTSLRLTGDGAATSVVLTRALLARALQHVAGGGDTAALKTELEAAMTTALDALLAEARPLSKTAELQQIVHQTSRTEAKYAADVAINARILGVGGSLTVGPPSGSDMTRIVRVGGLSFSEAWASPWFVTDTATLEAVLPNPYILVVDGELKDGGALAPILAKVAQTGRPLLIAAKDFGPDALDMLAINRLSGACQVSGFRAPNFRATLSGVMSDIAVITEGKVLKPEAVSRASLGDLGQAVEARQGQFSTAIICDAATVLRAQKYSDQLTDESLPIAQRGASFDLEGLQARIKRVDRGTAVIHLGTDDDPGPVARAAAHAASFAAVEEGGVVGGGGAFVRAGAALGGDTGAKMLRAALEEPCRWIARNAGVDDDAVVQASLDACSEFGFNADTGRFENLRVAGVVDLAMTLRWALRAAVSTTTALMQYEPLLAEARVSKRTGLPRAASLQPLAVEPGAVRDPAAEAAAPDVCLMLIEVGERNVSVTREVMNANPGMNLHVATTLVKSAPQPIKVGLRPREAEALRDKFVDLGARVEIR